MDDRQDPWFSKHLADTIRRERGTWRKHYPRWTRCLQWGFEHGDGWRLITERLFTDLSALLGADAATIQVDQIKAKFGTYRFYYAANGLSEGQKFAVQQRAGAAYRQAQRTCETCGRPGTLVRDRKWHHVPCPAHARKDLA
jgi:hypothetical protein